MPCATPCCIVPWGGGGQHRSQLCSLFTLCTKHYIAYTFLYNWNDHRTWVPVFFTQKYAPHPHRQLIYTHNQRDHKCSGCAPASQHYKFSYATLTTLCALGSHFRRALGAVLAAALREKRCADGSEVWNGVFGQGLKRCLHGSLDELCVLQGEV